MWEVVEVGRRVGGDTSNTWKSSITLLDLLSTKLLRFCRSRSLMKVSYVGVEGDMRRVEGETTPRPGV